MKEKRNTATRRQSRSPRPSSQTQNEDRRIACEIPIGVRPIEASRSQLIELIDSLHLKHEADRASLAAKIHDDLMQNLTVVSLSVSVLRKEVEEAQSTSELRFLEALKRIETVTANLIKATRILAAELRPKS